MKGLEYAISLMDKNFGSGMNQAKRHTKDMDSAVNKVNSNMGRMKNVGKDSFGSLISGAKKAAAAIGLAFGIAAAVQFGNEITTLTAQFQGMTNAIEFASGEGAEANLRFLDKTIKDLNLDMTASYKGFQTLTGSMKGTKLEGKGVRDIFQGVATAATVMNLTGEQTEGAFLALSQMASKGKVQAEELRGQLGERIPGALKIAADSMGVTQEKFNELLDSGKIYAEDFLPKFSAQLQKTFEGGLPKAADSMQAAINKKNNALLSFKRTFGEAFEPTTKSLLTSGTELFTWLEELIPKLESLKPPFDNLLMAFQPIIDAFGIANEKVGGVTGLIDNFAAAMEIAAVPVGILSEGIGFLIENFDLVTVGIGAYLLQQKILAIQTLMATTGTNLFTLATHGLNAAFKANPIGFVLGIIIALVGAIKYAYNNLGWFRGAVLAAWETIKGFAIAIKDHVIRRFHELLDGVMGIGKAIKLFFKGDWDGAWNAGKEAVGKLVGTESKKQLIDDMKNVGQKAGEAYRKGVMEIDATNDLEKSMPKNITVQQKAPQSMIDYLASVEHIGADKKEKLNTSTTVQGGTNSLAGGGGKTEKHTTFNIQSFVKEMTISVQSLKESPQDIKREMNKIFQEWVADLELRTDAN